MHWIREGADWVLKLKRRKLGRVFPDDRYPGMWRSRRADGQLSDMANLSWAKHAVLAAAERDIAPSKSPVKLTVFETKSPYVAPIDQGVGDEAHPINPGPRRAGLRRASNPLRSRLSRIRPR